MKKLFMILLVFVCSIVLCVSVFAVEAQACEDDGCTAEAVHEEEVVETRTSSTGTPCAHNHYYNDYQAIDYDYCGPASCMVYIWQVVRCKTCYSSWRDSLISSYSINHNWADECPDGVSGCDYCTQCKYHSR